MSTLSERPQLGVAAKIGTGFFALWGVLHMWVGYEGVHQYLASPAKKQWEMLLGGANAPIAAFQFPVDALTANVHAHLLLNFCLDVAGYGLLGLVVASMIRSTGSWAAYFIGAVVIGLCDLSFLFTQVTSGIIELNLPTVSGPILWFLAVLITPFGMPTFSKKEPRQ